MVPKHNKILTYLGICLCVFCLLCGSASLSAAAERDTADDALKRIVTYRFGDSRSDLVEIESFIRTNRDSADRLWLEREFARILVSDATYDCKEFICRQLRIFGSDDSVVALGKLLVDDTTADIARYALNSNSSSAAGQALQKALKKTAGKTRIGIISSLGDRKDMECVDDLIPLVFDSSTAPYADDVEDDEKKARIMAADTAIAAINALAKIGGMKAGDALSRAKQHDNTSVSTAASAAFLTWADNLSQVQDIK